MKKTTKSSASRSFLVSLIFFLLSITIISQEIPITIESIEQINYFEPWQIEDSPSAKVKIIYEIPTDQHGRVLNILAKSEFPEVEDVWWGQNIILNPFPNPVSLEYILDLHPLGTVAGLNIEEITIGWVITEEILKEPPQIPGADFVTFQVENFDYIVGTGVELFLDTTTLSLPPFVVAWSPATDTNWIYRGCEVPNIDLDNSTYPFNMDNQGNVFYQGDKNACAQAALANSFAWLESQHPEINTGLTTREMIQQLDQAVNRDFVSGAPNMQGVIEGALDFVDSNQIPVSVKFQSLGLNSDIDSPNFDYGHSAQNNGTDPQNPGSNQVSWDWIKSEMEAGEDVTMVYSNWDGTAWTTSHAVALTGISKDPNNMKLTYKDDSDQAKSGGTSETQIDVRELNGWLVTNQLAGSPGNQIITAVVSKSYDPSVTFNPVGVIESLQNEFIIKQNFPNPFNPVTNIEYTLPITGFVTIKIYNQLGEIVDILRRENQIAGNYELSWNAENHSSGIYFCRIKFNENSKSIKMILLK